MTSDAEPLSAMPFESIRQAIVSLGSDIELDDVTMLLALHDDAHYHRQAVRALERQVEAARAENARLKQILADVREIERKASLALAQEAVYARTERALTPDAPTKILEASKLLVDIEIACMALGLPIKAALAPQPAPTDGIELSYDS